MNKYDLIIIGGGPAGYLAAERAAEGGYQVLLFENKSLGGVCLNEGCIPTKTILHSAKMYDNARNSGAFGVTAYEVHLDQKSVVARKKAVVKTLVSGVGMQMRRNKVAVQYTKAEIKEKTEEGFVVESEGMSYLAKRLLVATGSDALIPPIPGIHSGFESGVVLTNRELLDLEELPKHLVIIGAGVIGLEMAIYFCTVGVKVTIVEMMTKIAGSADCEISAILQKEMEKKGVAFLLGHKVVEIRENGLLFDKDGENGFLEADRILLSIGRKPATRGCGLENVGVAMKDGAVVTDEYLRTNVPLLYAAGDINGKFMLAHTAYRESEVAVHHMFGIEDSMHYDMIPSVIYTMPEVASIGETEESAKSKNLSIKIAKLPMTYSGRYVAEHVKGNGICKLILDQETNCLIGAHMIGGNASEIIWGMAAVMEQQVSVEEIKKIVFPHPSVSEIIRETTFKFN